MVQDARQRTRAWYGGALLATLVALAVLIFFLDAIRASFERRYSLVVVMDRAPPGLGDGSPVWIGGKEVGTVTSVGFLPSGPDTLANVAVTIDLPRAARQHVRADSRVRLTSARMIGEPALDLVPGSPAAPVIAPGDTLRVQRRRSVEELSREAAAVRAGLDTTLQELRRLAPRVRVRLRETRRAFAALDAVIAEAGGLQRAVEASPNLALFTSPAFGESLAQSRAQAAELSRLLAVWRARATDGGELRSAFDRFQLHADSLRAQLDATAALVQSGNGTLARLQRDSALIHAVTAARAELDSLVAATRRNPLRFFF